MSFFPPICYEISISLFFPNKIPYLIQRGIFVCLTPPTILWFGLGISSLTLHYSLARTVQSEIVIFRGISNQNPRARNLQGTANKNPQGSTGVRNSFFLLISPSFVVTKSSNKTHTRTIIMKNRNFS